jgi:type IV secretory pathway VirD2 relaxase
MRPLGPKNARRVVVKAHVHRMGPSGAKAAKLHLLYIERDGVERDGSKGVLYGADGPAWAEEFEAPRKGEKHQFRIIVSPEDGAELDMTAYLRRLMATVERDLGRRLEWAAVNHHDTEHPHAHVITRGLDRDGREFRMDRAYISSGLRWRAQELATDELGPRIDPEVRRTRELEVTQERFTSLDRDLERCVHGGRIDTRWSAGGYADAANMVARLKHLEGLHLAERASATSWQLSEGWQQRLRDLGARGDIIKQIHDAVSGDSSRYHVVGRGQAVPTDAVGGGPVVTGRVAAKGLSDELKGEFFAVIETPTGGAYHVALDRRASEAVRTGEVVTFTTKPETAGHDADRRQAEGSARHLLVFRKEPLSLQEQVFHRGPVWLDRVKTDALAPYGFGAELRQTVERRRDVLRTLGVRTDDPKRWARLREEERKAVGKEVADHTRRVFMPDAPIGFRGRLEPGGSTFPGSDYVIVSDGARFAVLHASVAARGSYGRNVVLERGAGGRILVQEMRGREGPTR